MNLAGDPNERVRDREAARGERSPARRRSSRRLRERLIITDDKNPRYVNRDTRITARLIKSSRIKTQTKETRNGSAAGDREDSRSPDNASLPRRGRVFRDLVRVLAANRAHDVTRATRDALARAHARTRRERRGGEGRREQGVRRQNRHDHRSHAGVR